MLQAGDAGILMGHISTVKLGQEYGKVVTDMSDDHRDSDQEYWDDVYYFENYLKEEESSGCAGSNTKGSFWIWFIALIIVCNISSGLGEAFIIISLIWWIISKFVK